MFVLNCLECWLLKVREVLTKQISCVAREILGEESTGNERSMGGVFKMIIDQGIVR